VIKKFNEYSQQPSKFISALDTQDLKRLLSTGGACAIGQVDLEDGVADDVIAAEVSNHFFMDGFDLKTASACGVVIVGSEKTLQTTGAAKHISSVFDSVNQYLDGGMFFRGVYADDNVRYLRVYILFNGLALPSDHINDMMKQVRAGYNKMKLQQNRLDDGIHVDFGSGVGGFFNNQAGAKKIERKQASPLNADEPSDSPSINVEIGRPNPTAPMQKPVANPVHIPGMKRGGR
jgi:hypothetical protein